MKNNIIDKENLNKPSLMLTLKLYMHMTIYLVHNRLLYIYFLLSSCLLENRIPVTFIIAQILLSLRILTTQL